jgi:hypothetical protein
MRDTVLSQAGAERPRGQRGPVVGAQRELARADLPRLDCGVDDGDRFDGASSDVEVQPLISRVQQSMIAFR